MDIICINEKQIVFLTLIIYKKNKEFIINKCINFMKKVSTVLFALFAVLYAQNGNGQNFVRVNQENNGKTITLSTEQVLEIYLPRKSSNGYIWCESTSTNKSILRSVTQFGDVDFIHEPATKTSKGKRMLGQSGTQIIRYVGISSGTTKLTFELKRPWEKNGMVLDNYSITVISDGKYTGNYTPALKKNEIKHTTSTSSILPSRWDWRPKCTPIANQQQCGDCWAFAGVGVFECNIKISDDSTRDISEAYLTNCDTAYYGCNGGGCPLDYWLAPRGAVYESECPWTTSLGGGTTGTCGGPYIYHETINSWGYVPGEDTIGIPPDEKMKEAIYYYGPIWVGVDASSSAWSSYSGGIFTEHNSNVDHAVVLVGWCDSASIAGGGYWILRNSWGTGWGVNGTGYMYISYGSDAIGTDAAYMMYKCKNNDFQMAEITYPTNACGLTNAEHVSARIAYNGCNTIPIGDTIRLAYKADNGAVQKDSIILTNQVNPGDTLDFTFHSTSDFSFLGTHSINCWVKFSSDTMALNDSIIGYTFVNRLHQNIDVGIIAINSPVSKCHMTNTEPVNVDVKFYGCDSLMAGNTMILAYRINGGNPVKDTILIPHTIIPEGTFNHTFTKKADLSAPGNYTIDAWTEYSVDTMHTNDMFSGYLVKSTSSLGFDTIHFEEPNINSLILVETTNYSHAWVSSPSHHTGTKGFQMTGGSPMDFIYMIQIPDSTDIWTVNSFLSAKLNFCIDATGWQAFHMGFDLKQTDGGALYQLYLPGYDYTKASSLRILVNGVQIGGTYNPTTTHNDAWATHYITLDSMAGKLFTVTIETRNISRDSSIMGMAAILDNAYIDNVYFSPLPRVSVQENNMDLSFGIYPNPFNNEFTVKFDADETNTVSVEITDMLGRIIDIRKWTVGMGSNRLTLNLGAEPAGMYFVKLTSSKGVAVKNVIKQ
jgi:C1A family cysteine protease